MQKQFVIVSTVLFALAAFAAEGAKFKIDGIKTDWISPPLLKEIGGTSRGSFSDGIDATQLYVSNDAQYLYLFIGTSPSFGARFKKNKSSGNFCVVYIDSDNNQSTGCSNVIGFRYGKINGYEYKVNMPIGIYFNQDGTGTFATYSLTGVQDDGKFSALEVIQEKSSHEDKDFIAHGKDGVECKIPLASLGVKSGSTIKLLIAENIHIFKKEGYSKTEYTIK